jgi:hypothetical protein
MKSAAFFVAILLAAGARGDACELITAAERWKSGDIEDALTCAQGIQPASAVQADSKSALLTAITFVKGQYSEAIEHHQAISRDSQNFKSTAILAAQAAHFLRDFTLSRRLIEEAAVTDAGMMTTFELFERQPLSIDFDGVDIIPFDYSAGRAHLPSFDVLVNGSNVKALMDTGASYVAMSPVLADKLRIKYAQIGEGWANDKPTKGSLGLASFSVGRLHATNVPVYVIESLATPNAQDLAIFGTTLLSNFLTTIDFPRRRLILSARDDPAARQRHLSEIASFETSMRFYMWFDHFMFAKGSLDENSNLNFFVDSGLAAVRSGRQAALYTSTATLQALGYSQGDLARPVIELRGAIGLGDLHQDRPLIQHSDHYQPTSFGGIAVHGLISHAFLEHYVWTIDFKNRIYGFSR